MKTVYVDPESDEVTERALCPECGRDLGPVQPLPSAKVKCPKCKKWMPVWENG